MAGVRCPPPGNQRRRPRCPLHRSSSKKFQSFSVSLGMQRLCRFYDFRPMAEPRPHTRSKNSDVKIYRAEITSRPTRGSEIFGELRLGFPGLEAALAIFPLHVLIGSALSTIEGHSTARWCRQTHRLALHRCVHWARGGRIDRPSRPTAESAPSSRCIAYTKHRLMPGAGIGRRRHRLATPPMRRPVPSSRSIARSGWLEAARYQAVVQADAWASTA